MTETELNQRVADQICRSYRWRDRAFEQGECVALLDGEVVAVTPELSQALESLRAIDPDTDRGMVFEVGPLIPDVIR